MLTNSLNVVSAVAGLTGVSTHVLLYRHGEWDVKAPSVVINYAILAAILNFRLYEETAKLHEKYGDYVRIGPSELSVTDPTAVKLFYSSLATAHKGPWYNCLEPRVSLQTDRDKASHARRRKVWDQGFSSQALRDYEPRVAHYAAQLIQAIEKAATKPMNMTQWFNYYSMDVMGDLSLGRSFDLVADGEDKYFLTQLHADMKMIGLFSHLMWLFPFFKRIPGINADYLKFWKWLGDHVDHRMKNAPSRPDVFSWLLNAFEQTSKTKQDLLNLHGDTYLISVAGSDTTAATMTNVFYELAKDLPLQRALQAELDALPDISTDQLSGLKFLDAIINETLRLHPLIPSGLQRMTPRQGIQIGDTYIPGDVMVAMPMHTLFRDERVFGRPNEFVPERWTTEPELIKDASAFIPFGAGPYVCVGKQLAFMEIRRVTAEILTRYDVSFAPEYNEASFWKGKQDAFTLVAAPMEMVFNERK
ncbi:cytochrome P450 oxidoreductase [Penicillium verhagenii]|uniref:cytochrome P450 oxidoreductase n=1 Tax=Penicillium verhagenii TaxID=1562060 RepID=UPI002544F9EC|nr:cytochrome P450 oxidoreductase [Penicillium verhagenii]KAJ5919142.1 cytochrome P450 oxidoreductase [Penicillium verhagenii]